MTRRKLNAMLDAHCARGIPAGMGTPEWEVYAASLREIDAARAELRRVTKSRRMRQ